MKELREVLVCYLPGYRRAPVVFLLTIILVVVIGVGVVADDAVPGDVLFPIDQGFEWVHRAWARTPQERVEFVVTLAHERALELSRIRSMTVQVGELRGNEVLAIELLAVALINAEETINDIRVVYQEEGGATPEWLIREEKRLVSLKNRLEGAVPEDVEPVSSGQSSSAIRQYLGN